VVGLVLRLILGWRRKEKGTLNERIEKGGERERERERELPFELAASTANKFKGPASPEETIRDH
jgi:hypothetical protein